MPVATQMIGRTGARLTCSLVVLCFAGSSACSLLPTERLIYDRQGIRIGVEPDPSVSRARTPIHNTHPANLTAEEIQSLFQAVQISGWSGTLVGIIETPRPIALFSEAEVRTVSAPLAAALHQAGPDDRVFFSLPNREAAYSEDRTAGSLFLRGRYLHVVVTDHSSVIRADTGGGDPKDIRDTKGLKLWVTPPAHAAMVPDLEEPSWAPFETVHISLNVKETLVQRSASVTNESPTRSSVRSGAAPADLQHQIRELTQSNLDLRGRLDEQNKRVQALTDELERLRRDLEASRSKKPFPKVPAP